MAKAITTTTTTQTALCIIPPENVWDQIQSIRSIHDKAYPRWMPHINLIYPFIPEENFENIKIDLESIVHRRKPFQIQFNQTSLDYFRQRGTECTYHLKPIDSKEIVELQKLIQNQLAYLIKSKRAFQAHLTLGQTTTKEITDVLNDLKGKWMTIEFTVDRIYMISRENHPENLFTIKNEILLLDKKEDENLSSSISNIMLNSIQSKPVNFLSIIFPNEFSSHFSNIFERTSFNATKSFQIILAEYENGPVNSELRSKLEAQGKFILTFGRDSLGFDEITSDVFLKPSDMEIIHQLNVLDDSKYDGRLTLGKLRQNDFDKVNERFMNTWATDNIRIHIDRIYLVDTNGKNKFIFRLRNF